MTGSTGGPESTALEGPSFSVFTGLVSIRAGLVLCGSSVQISATTSHSCWNPAHAPTLKAHFGPRLHPTAPEQLLGPLRAEQGSSKRIFSSTTLDPDHVCLQLRGQMGAGVLEHQSRADHVTAPEQK